MYHISKFIVLSITMFILISCGGGSKTEVTGNIKPIAVASVNTTSTSAGEVVIFDASSSEDSDGNINSYEWKEGSIILSSAQSFSKSDLSIGTHTIILTVKDNDNAIASDSIIIMIKSLSTTLGVPSVSSLKKTGQIKSYLGNGNVITDQSLKDDGFYQKGITPSYTRDVMNNIVTDHITGLVWQDDIEAKTKKVTWSGAKNYCSTLALAGGNWRLPSIEELHSILVGTYNPCIDTTVFVNYTFNNGSYWSSSSAKGEVARVWEIELHYGTTSLVGGGSNSTSYVRCVRTQ